MYCGWLNRLNACAAIWNFVFSVNRNSFFNWMSQLLICRSAIVLRPPLASAPSPATMYRALGFTAAYATVQEAPVAAFPFTAHVVAEETTLPSRAKAVTSLPVLASPFGLTIVRSPAESPFRLE